MGAARGALEHARRAVAVDAPEVGEGEEAEEEAEEEAKDAAEEEEKAEEPASRPPPAGNKKVVVFKMKRRKHSRTKNGHRQRHSIVKITGINA